KRTRRWACKSGHVVAHKYPTSLTPCAVPLVDLTTERFSLPILVVSRPERERERERGGGTKMSKPVCAVIGIGPGNGTAIARKFSSKGYKIALLSRNEDYLNRLTHEWADTRAYAYDALDMTAPEKVFGKIKQELGPIDVLVYNA